MFARSGFFSWFASARFRWLRHAFLRNKRATNVAGAARNMTLSTRHGQATLTAVGAWLSLRFALSEPEYAGVRFPEQDPANTALTALVERAGVRVERGLA
jgi:hypothetical protein